MTDIQKAASAMGKRSAKARVEKWGKADFVRKMREWGKKGGRPKGSSKRQKAKGK